jgi:hypothetical protein
LPARAGAQPLSYEDLSQSVTVILRLSPELKAAAEAAAKRCRIGVSRLIRKAIEKELAARAAAAVPPAPAAKRKAKDKPG